VKNRQLQDLKSHLNEFVYKVAGDGSFVVTVHGKQKAALVPMNVYEKLYPKKRESVFEFFQRSPLKGSNIKIERDKSRMKKENF
jgi:prevent-host-death family protein